jgi:hypothetical protein
MSAAAKPWREAWFKSIELRGMRAWRAVEAQHAVATMRLVDNLDEQAVLESLLEASKPPLPTEARRQHYLLATPFRYRPRHGSRFRPAGSRGIWYGAAEIRTACAETAYWRWRFLMDSAGLQGDELLTEHTLFAAEVQGPSIDLTAKPWVAARKHWVPPDDYTTTQAVAAAAQERGVGWLRYESVRDAQWPGPRQPADLALSRDARRRAHGARQRSPRVADVGITQVGQRERGTASVPVRIGAPKPVAGAFGWIDLC